MKQPNKLKEDAWRGGAERLLSYLAEIPFLQAQFLDTSFIDPDSGLDGLLHLRLPVGDVLAAISVKSSGEIGVARQVALNLMEWRNRYVHNSYPHNTGPFVSSAFSSQGVPAYKEAFPEGAMTGLHSSHSNWDKTVHPDKSFLAGKTLTETQFFPETSFNPTVFAPTVFSPLYGIFIAPYISPSAAAFCREKGIGYCDSVGNCYLSFGQVYIRRENWPDPNKRPQQTSLWSTKSQRVLRVLLENPLHGWKTESLSKEADVSAGLISNVRGELEDRDWLEETEDGFVLIEPWSLLKEWALNYKIDKKKTHLYYSLDGLSEIEARLGSGYQNLGLPNEQGYRQFALTGFSGAAHLAPYAKYTHLSVYVSIDIYQFADVMGLRRIDSGENVRLIEPYDEGVFYKSSLVHGAPVVCATQLYLDLRAEGGRGNDAANYLLEKVLQPRWEQARNTHGHGQQF